MNKILSKNQLAAHTFNIEVEAPLIARSYRAGNFVIIRVEDKSERLPISVSKVNPERGSITIVVKEVNHSTARLVSLEPGDAIKDIVGPLGTPIKIETYGTILFVCDDIGSAIAIPIISALKKANNRILVLLSSEDEGIGLMMENIREVADAVFYIGANNDDITESLKTALTNNKVDKIIGISTQKFMHQSSIFSVKYQIPCDVYLRTIMVDGTGMCGACRLTIGGKIRFACIDGPWFDGCKINWEELIMRTSDVKALKIEDENPNYTINDFDKNTINLIQEDDALELLSNRKTEWREALRKQIKSKDRMALEHIPVPTLDPIYRATTRIEEVAKGYTMQMATAEAHRCLDCSNPGCVKGCPVSNDIPAFIKNIERGNILGAYKVLRNTSSLPAICGRVCPHEKQCEGGCIHNKISGKPVSIGGLERYVADSVREQHIQIDTPSVAKNGIKVAVVGSGPAGLSFAGEMIKKGFSVFVFEALHELGGVLKYGIPEFRLPNKIVDIEIDNLRKSGVHFFTDVVVGKTITIESLKKRGFKGFFIGSGAGVPNFMGIQGENAVNVLSSNEFLARINLMDATNPKAETSLYVGKKIIVVGGGNTAMDACRMARRLGAEVTVVYRRSEMEMPAGRIEILQAKEEGIKLLTLHNPKKYIIDKKGYVTNAILDVMELGEPDESGRRSPKTTGKEIIIECDQVIVAVGTSPNPLVPRSIKGLNLGWKDTIVVDNNRQSSCSEIYAGGDIVNGPATVVLAMGDGRKAAKAMAEQLMI